MGEASKLNRTGKPMVYKIENLSTWLAEDWIATLNAGAIHPNVVDALRSYCDNPNHQTKQTALNAVNRLPVDLKVNLKERVFILGQ